MVSFTLAPAGISLLTTESDRGRPLYCGQYHVVEGDQQTKLCMYLLGQGGTLSADLTLLDGTTRGVCVCVRYVCQTPFRVHRRNLWSIFVCVNDSV